MWVAFASQFHPALPFVVMSTSQVAALCLLRSYYCQYMQLDAVALQREWMRSCTHAALVAAHVNYTLMADGLCACMCMCMHHRVYDCDRSGSVNWNPAIRLQH